jgi:hypothetical protein
MIVVRIGGEEHECPVDSNWVNQLLKGLKETEATPCVRVTIRLSDVDVVLASQGCGSGGGGRPLASLTPAEQNILALWKKHHLDQPEFSGGNLVSFLKQLGCS